SADFVDIKFRHEGAEAREKRPINIIRNHNQVRPFALNQMGQPLHRAFTHCDRWRIARIDKEERLDRWICQFIDLSIGVLPGVAAIDRRYLVRIDLNNLKIEPIEMANFDVGCESGNREGNLVPAMQKLVHNQGIEDVAHRSRATLDGENVYFFRGGDSWEHFLCQVGAHDALGVDKHSVRRRVLIPDDAVDQFVDESIGVELELFYGVFNCSS